MQQIIVGIYTYINNCLYAIHVQDGHIMLSDYNYMYLLQAIYVIRHFA